MDINAINGLQQPAIALRPFSPSSASSAVNAEKSVAAKAEEVASTTPAAEQERQPVEEAISSIKQFAQSIQRNLNFALDDSSGRVVVKVTDAMSGDVIRQIPSEDALRLAESLEEARSLLFKAEA
ncbi:flagellar protein FlaG [Pseudomonas guineae]|uniref:flagellar protein FlaG n=1 Tax=Pseudomonas guineae TaxID=425504 RepID=UPI003CFD9F41